MRKAWRPLHWAIYKFVEAGRTATLPLVLYQPAVASVVVPGSSDAAVAPNADGIAVVVAVVVAVGAAAGVAVEVGAVVVPASVAVPTDAVDAAAAVAHDDSDTVAHDDAWAPGAAVVP